MKRNGKNLRGRENLESSIKNIGINKKDEREEISSKNKSIAYEWKQSLTSSEIKIKTVKNKKKNKITGNRSEIKKTLRNIERLNIKRYAKNIQKYLDRRSKFTISTREKRTVKIHSILYKNKSYPTQNLRNIVKTTMRRRKITATKNTYIRCSKKNSNPRTEKTLFVPRIKTKHQKYAYIQRSNKNLIPNRSIISWPPRIQSKHERHQNKNDIEKFRSHNWEEEQNLMITEQQNYNCNDKPQITSIDDTNVSISTKKKVDVSSKLHQISAKDIVKVNLIGNESCRGIELVNTTFQHKNKHEDASVNHNTTHTIVENSNASEGNVTMITNNDKGGKK